MLPLLSFFGCTTDSRGREDGMGLYTLPGEDSPREGTWLSWPHHHTYGKKYRDEIEPVWVAMTDALTEGERVHIIACDEAERDRIVKLLENAGVDMDKVDFVIVPTDDVWVRDTGPIFGFDKQGRLTIVNFAFDGWGKKAASAHDDAIPVRVAELRNFPLFDASDIVIEEGAIELDGAGTLMACESSVVSPNRNPEMSRDEMEERLRYYLGITNFVWLEGALNEDITDAHIDGMARFLDSHTILAVARDDFGDLYESISMADYDKIVSARNAAGEPYKVVEFPLTKKKMKGLGYKGSYLNFYVGNKVILMPVYNDVNDSVAAELLARLYPGRRVVKVDVTKLYKYGGMLHCVTQQQPQSPR